MYGGITVIRTCYFIERIKMNISKLSFSLSNESKRENKQFLFLFFFFFYTTAFSSPAHLFIFKASLIFFFSSSQNETSTQRFSRSATSFSPPPPQGINVGLCVVLFSLYSILRKQPGNASVYFGRKLTEDQLRKNPFCFDRFVPSASWIAKAWTTTEEEILDIGGLDAVVFLRILVFSIRIFAIAAAICMFSVVPLNYYGQEMVHKKIPSESVEVFTIANVEEESKWLWVHCLALYVISLSACILLYFEYKSIGRMRLEHIINSPPKPSHFAVLVRSIPWSPEEPYSDVVEKFFTKYHAASYLSHQMVYRSGTIQKIMNDARKMYRKLKQFKPSSVQQLCEPCIIRCNLCGSMTNSFKRLTKNPERAEEKTTVGHVDSDTKEKECAAAFVFFRTRYAAVVASNVLQSSNPMLWVTDLAPEPHDVYWSNLWIPYKQLWIRKIAIRLAAAVFMFLFIIPVALAQSLSQLEDLQKTFPFLKGILKMKYVSQVVTGYLPSVILLICQLTVPPTMMFFSAFEGHISRSGRKKSACYKVLSFTIWNVFFLNVLSGSIIREIDDIFTLRSIPALLARAITSQASFFMSYVLTSGWTGLAFEIMQTFSLVWNRCYRFAFWTREVPSSFALSFPYHTEVPRVLLFGLLGFTCSILIPLILPLLLFYFFLGYIVYRNQILNVYVTKYESGGLLWPIVHNTTIFSLILAQIIALGVFGLKQSPVAAGFILPLVILTLLFNEYCRRRFHSIFKGFSAEVLIDLDHRDEESGRMEEIYQRLHPAYCQVPLNSSGGSAAEEANNRRCEDSVSVSVEKKPALGRPTFAEFHLSGIRQAFTWLSMSITLQETNPPR